MSLWKIAWRSIQQRSLASALTVLSMGLGVALVVAVLVVYGVVQESFSRGGEGYDLIVGAKGGKEQLVLNSAFYLSQPIENIPYSYYLEFTDGRFAPYAEVAVPIGMGHSYADYRVVGTTPAMFDELTYRNGREYEFAPGGRNFRADEHFAGVIGYTVARRERLKVGDTFQAIHGLAEEGGETHELDFEIVGILEHTGTPNDRALFVNIEGFFNIHHGEHGDEEHDDAHETDGHSHDEDGHDHATPVENPSSLSGFVYVDRNGDGIRDPKEQPLAGVRVKLEMVGAPLETRFRSTKTDGHGAYRFTDLPSGEYVLKAVIPEGYLDGANAPGSAGGTVSEEATPDSDEISVIQLPPGTDAVDYEFAFELQVTAILVRVGTEFQPGVTPDSTESGTTQEIARIGETDDLAKMINRGKIAQAVSPSRVVYDLFKGLIGNIQVILLANAVLIVIVAGLGIMVSIYNSMSDRRREIAVMRALGASRGTVMAVILLESILLSLGGGVLGLVLGHGLTGALSPMIVEQTGVAVGSLHFQLKELILIPGLIILASLVGYLPAVAAYRTDVARSLGNTP